MNLDLLGDILMMVCCVSTVIFIIGYHFTAPWWRHSAGRNVMGLAVSLCLILLLNFAYVNLGAWYAEIRPWARIVVYALTTLVIWQRIVWWARKQLRGRKF